MLWEVVGIDCDVVVVVMWLFVDGMLVVVCVCGLVGVLVGLVLCGDGGVIDKYL